MKGLLSLLFTVVALGYGSSLLSAQQGGTLCGRRFDLTQDQRARQALDDIGRGQAIAERLRAQQRLLAPPCEQP
ncbi:MAG: hypothetical protein JO339_15225 [Alphaproteobacteria bacterium]|nr:hypothetical protein [Alphaproteobacteria bacterium]